MIVLDRMASGAADVDEPGKTKFLKKFGKRVGNVFSKKRNSQTASIDNDFPFPPPQHGSTGVIKNPLVGADIPSPDVYAPSQPHLINTPAEPRSGGGRAVSAYYDDVGELPSVAHEELSPPERCLSEGDLVESSAPQRSERLGGRVWRAVPGSMDNLPKSFMGELSRKINTRGHSGSEDEGLPRSPPADPLPAPAPAPASLSQSSKSLTSCGDSSDGERPEELDFNALRRAESLDNTAAKHRIQVGRQRRKAAGPGALRKHKSCTTVQLAGITEEAPGKEELQVPPLRRQVSHESAALLSQELQKMRWKEEEDDEEEEKKKERKEAERRAMEKKQMERKETEKKKMEMKKTEKKEIDKGRAAPSTTVPVLRPVRKVHSSLSNPLPSATPATTSSTAASSTSTIISAPTSSGVSSSTATSYKVSSSTASSSRVSSSTAAFSGVSSSRVSSSTAASSGVSSSTAASSGVSSSAVAASGVSSSTAASSGVSSSAVAASRIGRLRSMFSEPSSEPPPRPASSTSHRPASRIQSSAGDSAPPAPSVGIVKAASLCGSASKSFMVPSVTNTEQKPKPPGSPASPPPSLLFSASGGTKVLSAASTSPTGSKTLPPTATKAPTTSGPTAAKPSISASAPSKPTSTATRGPSNFTAAKLSFKAGDPPKAPVSAPGAANSQPARKSVTLPASTRKAPESSTGGENVLLREKKPVETAEEVASRPVSRVMDLVRNFQRLQDTSTS